jgi:hypothetical protein
MTIARKAHKYLFTSSAFRMSFYYITGQANTFQTRIGRLMEDSVGGHLYRDFVLSGKGAIRYDSAEGGADFVLQIMNNKQILIEVSRGQKGQKQVISSNKRIPSAYNIVISSSWLKLSPETKTLFLPLDYYFII